MAEHERREMWRRQESGFKDRRGNGLPRVRRASAHCVGIAVKIVSHSSTTQNSRDKRPARKKRSGEQDKDEQTDGGRTNGSFSDPNFFEKKIFYRKIRNLGRKYLVFGFVVLYTYYPILDSIIFLIKTRLLAWRDNKMYVLLKRL
jgi:hypothetical protein